MLTDLWPTYAIRIHTPRLTLRLPGMEELVALAELAGDGVHPEGEQPFLTPWTDGSPQDRARRVFQGFWSSLQAWQVGDWQFTVGVFWGNEPVGMATLRASDFTVVREVATFSWLGLEYHGRGIGTEVRTGLLTLAFDHLGAVDATTEVFPTNHASLGVSRKLGYQPDGISRDARGTDALVSYRLRLTATQWGSTDHAPVAIEGIDQARSMFTG